jgi:hypothetical protein
MGKATDIAPGGAMAKDLVRDGFSVVITLQTSGLFVFVFIDIYVQCNYDEKHTVNILAVIVSPFLKHMRPREICYCLRLELLNVSNRLSILEVLKVPHRVSCTRSLKSSPQTVHSERNQVTISKNVTISPPLPKREFCRMIGSLSCEFPDWWTNLILSKIYLPLIGCFQLSR